VITIDDEMIVLKWHEDGSIKPIFADYEHKALWPVLIEKAWAKMKGTYAAADGGFTPSGLRAVTGAPVFEHFMSKMNKRSIKNLFKLI